MLVLAVAIASLVRLPIIFVWELLKPASFHERPFDRALWRSFQSYEVANERGQMYDDLAARGLIGRLTVEKRVLAVLGPPDERSSRRLYWLAGRWHSVGDTCLVVVFDPDRAVRRYGLVKLSGQAALSSHCGAGTLLPESLPAASEQ